MALGEHVGELVPVSLAPWPPESRSREQFVGDLKELLGSLGDVEDGPRRRWLKAQVRALDDLSTKCRSRLGAFVVYT